METVTIPKEKLEQMQKEIKLLKNSRIYKRLLNFEKRISKGKKYTREELGF